jgi:uracil phosphoribosyltransferase
VALLRKVRAPVKADVYKVNHPELPRNSYILRMAPARKIIYNPLLWGEDLRQYTNKCNQIFLKTAWNLVPSLKRVRASNVCEVVVLRGGLGYELDRAFEQTLGRYLQRCFVGARRYRVSSEEFKAEISYRNFDPLPDKSVLLMGDTIATGSSLGRTLAEVRDELRRRNYNPRKLIVFSIAAAFRGCTKLLEWEKRFREWWPGFRIYLFSAEALFGLEEGTHLRFRKPEEAIVPEDTKKYVNKVYGSYKDGYLPGNICAIFDWGDRNFKPDRHLEDVLKFARSSRKVAKDEKAKKVLKNLAEGARLELKRFKSSVKKPR